MMSVPLSPLSLLVHQVNLPHPSPFLARGMCQSLGFPVHSLLDTFAAVVTMRVVGKVDRDAMATCALCQIHSIF